MPSITAELTRKITPVNHVLILPDFILRSGVNMYYVEMCWSLFYSFGCH